MLSYPVIQIIKKCAILLIFFINTNTARCQSDNKYGLKTVDSAEYVELIQRFDDHELVDLKEYIPSIVTDIRYATSKNFMKRKMYPVAVAYLRKAAADSLRVVQQELNKMGYGLKIFDAYRPYPITVAFYESFPDTNYVASPYTGSRHNRGCAVDLTIIELRTGRDLVMPTAYDDFSARAHAHNRNVPGKAARNRKMLQKAMTAHGFEIYKSEWWHFDFQQWRNYPVMSVGFQQITQQ